MWVSSDRRPSCSQQRSTPRLWGTAVVKVWGTQNETKTAHNITYALHKRGATAPYKQPQSAKFRDDPGGVYDDVWCASQQSQAARSDSQDVFVTSNLLAATPNKATEIVEIWVKETNKITWKFLHYWICSAYFLTFETKQRFFCRCHPLFSSSLICTRNAYIRAPRLEVFPCDRPWRHEP